MGVMLCLLVFVLVRIRITSQQQTSTEDINELLEKLMHHNTSVNNKDETPNIPEAYNYRPDDQEAELPGNDSNIYYFKTYMAPRIKFKTNSETLQILHRSNRTIHSQVDRTYEVMSEDELIPGTSKNGLIDNDEPEKLRHGQGNNFSEKESQPVDTYGRSGDEAEKNFNMLEDLFQKQIVTKPTSEKSPYRHIPKKPLSLLHDYPEIVIDHISYNNDHNDSGSPTKVTTVISNKALPTETIIQSDEMKSTPKPNDSDEMVTTLEVIEVPKDKYPELKDFVKTIVKNRESPTTAVTEPADPKSESRQQSDYENQLHQLSNAGAQENEASGSIMEPRSGVSSIVLDTPMAGNDINFNRLQMLSLQNLQHKYLGRRLTVAFTPQSRVLSHRWMTKRPALTPIIRPAAIKLPFVTHFLRPELRKTNIMRVQRLTIPRLFYRTPKPLLFGYFN